MNGIDRQNKISATVLTTHPKYISGHYSFIPRNVSCFNVHWIVFLILCKNRLKKARLFLDLIFEKTVASAKRDQVVIMQISTKINH